MTRALLDQLGLSDEVIEALAAEKKRELLALLDALKARHKYNKIDSLYPDTGRLRRELYPKHLEFFEAGENFTERLNMSGNRCGKTLAGAFETTNHLTGKYPEWWPGRRFDGPTECWAAGNTSETTRDIVQLALLGPEHDIGSGLIPKHLILDMTRKAGGVTGAIDTVMVQSVKGVSQLGFKCYAQGRKSFEGTAKHAVWFDEECPFDVYSEALMRIVTTKGMVYTTFTPLMGLTELVLSFMPQEYAFSVAA